MLDAGLVLGVVPIPGAPLCSRPRCGFAALRLGGRHEDVVVSAPGHCVNCAQFHEGFCADVPATPALMLTLALAKGTTRRKKETEIETQW